MGNNMGEASVIAREAFRMATKSLRMVGEAFKMVDKA